MGKTSMIYAHLLGFMTEVGNWLMVFLRASAMLLAFPVFSSVQVPPRVRVGLAAVVALVVSPGLAQVSRSDMHLFDLMRVMMLEIGAGLMMGYVAKLIFHGLEVFAALVGVEIGLNMGPTLNPISEGRTEVFGSVSFMLGAMLLFTLDMHLWVLAAFRRSYELVPMGGAGLSMTLFHDILGRTAGIFQAGLVLAAPVMAISFLVSVTCAVMSRAVPTMNVFAESFSFRILGGLMVLGMTLNLLAQHLANYFRRLPDDILRIARMLGQGG